MFHEDEKIAIAGHDGRCFPCDRGRENRVVVTIPRDARDLWRLHDLSQQLDLRPHCSREQGVVSESNDEDLLELVQENGAGDERDLTTKHTHQKRSWQTAKHKSGDQNVGAEHDAHLARLRHPVLLHNSCDIGFLHAAPASSLAACRKDPLPTLEPTDVLPERLAQELTAGPPLGPSHPVNFASKSWRQGDRYGPWRSQWSKVNTLSYTIDTSFRRSSN